MYRSLFFFLAIKSNILFNHELHFMSNVHTLCVEKRRTKKNVAKVFLWMCDLKKSNSVLFTIFKEWFQNSWQYIKIFRFLFIRFLEKDFNICIKKKYIFSSKKYFCIPNRNIGRLVLTFPKSTIFRNIC